jgi:quercetin dioxygenase-like cupin family protein
MPVVSGFGVLAELSWERVTNKIERRVLSRRQGMIVWWKMKSDAYAAAHQHPHEHIVWMLNGKMDFRVVGETRSMVGGDAAVIPSGASHFLVLLRPGSEAHRFWVLQHCLRPSIRNGAAAVEHVDAVGEIADHPHGILARLSPGKRHTVANLNDRTRY